MPIANRAITRLLQLGDEDLFATLSEGLELIAKNALQHEAASRDLTGSNVDEGFHVAWEHPHLNGARMLLSAAEEEAAKFLVLIDFLRCPKALKKERSRQLDYFYNHLAKGVYIDLAYHEYNTFREIIRYCDIVTKKFLLDGEYEVFIFYNEILSRREGNMYVNFKWYGGDNYSWESPSPHLPALYISPVLERMKAFWKVGVTTKAGLEVLSQSWQTLNVTQETNRDEISKYTMDMLKSMNEKGLLNESAGNLGRAFYNWFPLYLLDIKLWGDANMQEEKERAESAIMAAEFGVGDYGNEW